MLLATSSGSRLLDLFASCVDLTFGTGRFQLCAILADVPSGRRLPLPNKASPDGSLHLNVLAVANQGFVLVQAVHVGVQVDLGFHFRFSSWLRHLAEYTTSADSGLHRHVLA